MRFPRLAPDHLVQQVALFALQRISPFARTQTTTTDKSSRWNDRHVLGVRYVTSPRARCHRNPHPRGTLARRTASGSGTL